MSIANPDYEQMRESYQAAEAADPTDGHDPVEDLLTDVTMQIDTMRKFKPTYTPDSRREAFGELMQRVDDLRKAWLL